MAEVGDGPAIATVKLDGFRSRKPTLKTELQLLDPFGTGSKVLASGRATRRHAPRGMPSPWDVPTWSGDGSEVAYIGLSGNRNHVFMVGIDDGRLRVVPKTGGATVPVLAGDGSLLAYARTRQWTHIDPKHFKFAAYESTSTWLLDLNTLRAKRLTPWRNGLDYEPTSFSPDGATLLLSRSSDRGDDVVAMHLSDGGLSTLAREAEQGVYSPDGSRIALISYRDRNVIGAGENASLAGELYAMDADGGGLSRLTRTPKASESSPSWDPSGRRLAFVRSSASGLGALFPFGDQLIEVNSDGTCARPMFRVLKIRAKNPPAYYGAVWRPGSGREAGPISC